MGIFKRIREISSFGCFFLLISKLGYGMIGNVSELLSLRGINLGQVVVFEIIS